MRISLRTFHLLGKMMEAKINIWLFSELGESLYVEIGVHINTYSD